MGRVEVHPAAHGTGLRFVVDGGVVPVNIAHARNSAGSTLLSRGDRVVRTPEHLLAALVAHQVSDAILILEGPEVPILDGSARPWCEAVGEVGVVGDAPEPLVAPSVRVAEFGGVAEAEPGPILRLEVDVCFERGPQGTAAVEIPGAFCENVAFARTFAMERDIERLRAVGRGVGANLDNTVIWGDDGPINSVRSPDEPVLHKLVDLVGDLALVGRPVTGTIRVLRGSHALHHALVRALLNA
jgi:UDP-3-O-[3-hydroxymyristoyl] N-acetylglucosamine deacetylase